MFIVLYFIPPGVSPMDKVLFLRSMCTWISENLLLEFKVDIAHYTIVEMVWILRHALR